jgi:MFS family permease
VTRSASWSARTFASLDEPNYRRFFIGQAVSLTGTWMQSVALAWLVLELTHSPTWLGFAIALQFVPVLFLGPYGGVIVDRLDKRRLIIATQCAAAVQALVLGILAATGNASLAWVLVLSAASGLINVLDNPARQAFVREMVAADQVRNAVSLNAVLVNVARAVGPAVAGILIATIGVGVCFIINAASFAAAIIAYATMNTSTLNPSTPVARAPGQLRAGLAYVRRSPDLLVPLLMMALVGTLTYEFQVSLPALATETFGGDARSYGLITAAMGVGAVIGGLASAGRAATGIGPMATAAAAFGVTDLITALTPTAVWAGISLIAVGASSIWFLSLANATIQVSSSAAMRGRVMALWSVAFLGSTPIGGPLIGWVAETFSPRWALAVGAAAALAAAALGAVALRRQRATALRNLNGT